MHWNSGQAGDNVMLKSCRGREGVDLITFQGHIVANWRSRYFVLSPGKLSYYNSEDDPVIVSCFRLP